LVLAVQEGTVEYYEYYSGDAHDCLLAPAPAFFLRASVSLLAARRSALMLMIADARTG
jgi:hypothetical protein